MKYISTNNSEVFFCIYLQKSLVKIHLYSSQQGHVYQFKAVFVLKRNKKTLRSNAINKTEKINFWIMCVIPEYKC